MVGGGWRPMASGTRHAGGRSAASPRRSKLLVGGASIGTPMTAREASLLVIGSVLAGLSVLAVFTAGFSGQNGAEPGEEQAAVYTLLVAVGLWVVASALASKLRAIGAAGAVTLDGNGRLSP